MESIDRRHDAKGRLYVMYDVSTGPHLRYVIKQRTELQGDETVGEIHHVPPGAWRGFAWGTGRMFVRDRRDQCFDAIIEAFDEAEFGER